MSYRGGVYAIPCQRGGNVYSPNYDSIPPESMVDPSKNIDFHTGGRTKRGGTSHVNATAITGTPSILSGYDFRLRNNAGRFIVFHTDSGSLYKNETTTIKTGLSSGQPICFETFNNELYAVDGQTTPQTWDGAAPGTSNITTPAGDWSGSNQPKFVVKHGRGASQRLWFAGVATHEDSVYYTDANDGKDAGGGGVIRIETGDGLGIVGLIEWGERLLAAGKRKFYVIDDEDIDLANWGYQAVQWEGGAAHHRLIVKTPNDIVAMAEDGEIYSVTSVPDYGDYKQASISRPAFIHNWIKDNVNLASIEKFHAIYDPGIRAIKFWVVRNGQTNPDTALVFFIDRNPTEAWTIHDNLDHRSGYDALCSFVVRKSVGITKVYTGDNMGFMWELETDTKNDNSNGFAAKFRTPPLHFGDSRSKKKYRRGWIVFYTRGDYDVNLTWWVDNVQQSTIVVSTSGGGYVYGGTTYGSGYYSGQEIEDEPFKLGRIGKRIQLEVENSVADEDFYIASVLIDSEPIGARVA